MGRGSLRTGPCKAGRGRVRAIPYIAPAEEKGIRELEEGIMFFCAGVKRGAGALSSFAFCRQHNRQISPVAEKT